MLDWILRLSALMVVAALLFAVYRASASKWTIVILVDRKGRIAIKKGIAMAKQSSVATFLEKHVGQSQYGIYAYRANRSRWTFRFSGNLDHSLQQRIRNYFLNEILEVR